MWLSEVNPDLSFWKYYLLGSTQLKFSSDNLIKEGTLHPCSKTGELVTFLTYILPDRVDCVLLSSSCLEYFQDYFFQLQVEILRFTFCTVIEQKIFCLHFFLPADVSRTLNFDTSCKLMNEQCISSLKYANKIWAYEIDGGTLTTFQGRTGNPLSCFTFLSSGHKCVLLVLHVSIASC